MITHTEKRWALKVKFDWGWDFLGRFCVVGGFRSDPAIPTFQTRREARQAKRELQSYHSEARVVPVEVTVRSGRAQRRRDAEGE